MMQCSEIFETSRTSEIREKHGVLLVNLGSPKKPTTFHVASFLKNFLWDRRVVKINRLLWWFILHLLVIPLRSKRVAKLYKKIWMREGSPLIVYTNKLAMTLASELSHYSKHSNHSHNSYHSNLLNPLNDLNCEIQVYSAMTYGNPSLKNAVTKIISDNITDLIVIPLYPQYSSATTAAVFDSLTSLFRNKNLPSFYFISNYCLEESYLKALAYTIQKYGEQYGYQERLLFSFHGIPIREIALGDPYQKQCEETANRVAKILNFPENYWKIAYQSRFGYTPWTKPSLEDQLKVFLDEGVKSVLVIAPSFAVDCLETLEEINIRARELFIAMGGIEFHYVPALNDSKVHVNAFVSLIEKYFFIKN